MNDAILSDIVLFAQKLEKKTVNDNNVKTKESESDDALAGIDIDALVTDLDNKQKSHISFKDPSFDDLCDYSKCKICEIEIFESAVENEPNMDERMERKYNRKLRRLGWQMIKMEEKN